MNSVSGLCGLWPGFVSGSMLFGVYAGIYIYFFFFYFRFVGEWRLVELCEGFLPRRLLGSTLWVQGRGIRSAALEREREREIVRLTLKSGVHNVFKTTELR